MKTAILASRAFSPIVYLVALLSCGAPPAFAQLVSHADAPIRIGHYHLNVTSVEAHKKFWADTLGGRAMKFGGIDVIEFPDAFIFLRVQRSAGRPAAPPSITSASQCPTCRRWRLSWQPRDIRKLPGASRSRVSRHQRHRARRQYMDALRIFSVLTG